MPAKQWVAVVGLAFPDGKRIAAGETLTNPPEWLIEAGKVKPKNPSKKKATD